MADTKISGLSATTTVSSTDALPIARSGSNFQLSVNQIFNYVGQNAIPIPTLQSPAKTGTSANIQNTSLSVDGRVLLGGTGTAGANGNTILGGSTIAGNVAITGVTNTASGVLYTKAQTPLTTTLVSTITAIQTTGITLSDGTNFPASGSVVIDNEVISYTGLTSGTGTQYDLSGATRGASSSAASAHTASAVIASTTVASTTLSSSLAQGAVSIPVNSLASFPISGVVLIDNEQISYTGKSATTGSGNLTGCTRGYNGTLDVLHSSGAVTLAPVVASDNSYTYNASTGRLVVPYVQATGLTTSAVATSSISAPNSTVTAMSIDSAGVVTGGSVNLSLQQQVYQRVGASSPNAPSASTYFQWTSLPSWAKKITIMFSGVSNSGTATTDIPLIQLGYGGTPTYVTSGYLGCVSELFSSTNFASAQLSSGFATSYSQAATYVRHGIATLTNVGGTKWVYSCNLGLSDSLRTSLGGGSIDIGVGNTLTAVKVTTQNNTSTFSAGTINLLIE